MNIMDCIYCHLKYSDEVLTFNDLCNFVASLEEDKDMLVFYHDETILGIVPKNCILWIDCL